jgi:TRAP-type mannitol/chloroaromatic compound transport system permease large subunit
LQGGAPGGQNEPLINSLATEKTTKPNIARKTIESIMPHKAAILIFNGTILFSINSALSNG